MSEVKIKLNTKGIRNLLQSEDMKKEVERVANEKSGADTHIKTFIGFDRAKSIIYPNTKENK